MFVDSGNGDNRLLLTMTTTIIRLHWPDPWQNHLQGNIFKLPTSFASGASPSSLLRGASTEYWPACLISQPCSPNLIYNLISQPCSENIVLPTWSPNRVLLTSFPTMFSRLDSSLTSFIGRRSRPEQAAWEHLCWRTIGRVASKKHKRQKDKDKVWERLFCAKFGLPKSDLRPWFDQACSSTENKISS